MWVDDVFSPGTVTLAPKPSVGTVGEVYMGVMKETGQDVVVKLPKKGVDLESLLKEQYVVEMLVKKSIKDPVTREEQLAYIRELYSGWRTELDFKAEASAAVELAKNARRFDVAQPVQIGAAKNGFSGGVIYERASGVELAKLQEMLGVWRESPERYLQQYASVIEENPWLKDPAEWVADLSMAYLSPVSEQMLLSSRKQVKRLHGDPHSGNVFIHMDAKGQLRPTFIDTGLTVERKSTDIIDDIFLVLSLSTGNTKRLAELLMKRVKTPDAAASS